MIKVVLVSHTSFEDLGISYNSWSEHNLSEWAMDPFPALIPIYICCDHLGGLFPTLRKVSYQRKLETVVARGVPEGSNGYSITGRRFEEP